MPQFYRGTFQAQLQSESFYFDPQRGYRHVMQFKGLSAAQMTAVQQDFVNAGIACTLTFSQGIATLDADDTTQQFTIDTWQIVANEERRDLFSHPTVLALASQDQIASLRVHLENNDTPDTAFADTGSAGPPKTVDLTPLAGTAIERFYSLYQRGSIEYERAQYVLRHTTNVPNRYQANIADLFIENIYTTAQLLTEVQNAGLWVFPIPGRLVYKISNIPSPTPQFNYLWGWLKKTSTETTAPNNRVDITTDYILEQWSTDGYVIHP